MLVPPREMMFDSLMKVLLNSRRGFFMIAFEGEARITSLLQEPCPHEVACPLGRRPRAGVRAPLHGAALQQRMSSGTRISYDLQL